MRKTANGRSVQVLQGSTNQPSPVATPMPPQVPPKRTAPPVRQSFGFKAQ